MTELCCKCLEQQVPRRIGEEILTKLPHPDPASCEDSANLILVDWKSPGSSFWDRLGLKRQPRLFETVLKPGDLLKQLLSQLAHGW